MEKLKILVETSARHVHLTSADMAVLFGDGAKLTLKRELSQPGQFLSNERVSIVGPKSRMDNVAVLGPERKATQIELSLTDARGLGVTAPVRESGDVAGSGAIQIVGPKGTLEVSEGVIAAKRHIHLLPATAEQYGLKNGDLVTVTIEGPRALTFGEVVIRVSDKFADAMHVDVDEANAAALSGVVYGEVSK